MFIESHGYIIDRVGDVQHSKDGKHQFIECVFRKPTPKDEFGDQQFQDDVFAVRAWNKKIELLQNIIPGSKVKAQLTLSGSQQTEMSTGKKYFNMNLALNKIELL